MCELLNRSSIAEHHGVSPADQDKAESFLVTMSQAADPNRADLAMWMEFGLNKLCTSTPWMIRLSDKKEQTWLDLDMHSAECKKPFLSGYLPCGSIY